MSSELPVGDAVPRLEDAVKGVVHDWRPQPTKPTSMTTSVRDRMRTMSQARAQRVVARPDPYLELELYLEKVNVSVYLFTSGSNLDLVRLGLALCPRSR